MCCVRKLVKTKSLFVIKGDKMPQARFDLDPYTARVLDVVKGKYGLKNRQEALKKFIEEHGPHYAQMRIEEHVLKELDKAYAEHKNTFGAAVMSDEELDELLGL